MTSIQAIELSRGDLTGSGVKTVLIQFTDEGQIDILPGGRYYDAILWDQNPKLQMSIVYKEVSGKSAAAPPSQDPTNPPVVVAVKDLPVVPDQTQQAQVVK